MWRSDHLWNYVFLLKNKLKVAYECLQKTQENEKHTGNITKTGFLIKNQEGTDE